MRSGFYGAAIAAVAGLALGGLLKGPFSAESAPVADAAPLQAMASAPSEAGGYAEAPQPYAPVAYALSTGEDGGGAYLRAAYEVDPAEALLQTAAWREPAAPESGDGDDAGDEAVERAAHEAYAAGMTTPAVRPDPEAPFRSAAAAPAPRPSEGEFESIDSLIGAIRSDPTEPA